jgi:type IV pilus assembly protein PilW
MTLARRLRHAGFTLVELMISMALGLLIILALVMMLGNVNRNNSEMSNTNRIIESGRFAAQLLGADLSHAGYWGGYVPNWDSLQFTGVPALASTAGGAVPTALPDPCADYATWTSEYRANIIGIPVQSSDIVVATSKPFCDSVITSPKTNSDVLVVRHAETCVAGSGTNECSNTLTSASPDVHFQTSTCDTDAESFVISNAPGVFTLKKRAGNVACGGTADIRRLASTLYYVKDNGTASAPVLMRSTMSGGAHGTAQALVDGVEAFRVEFGIDSVSDSGGAVTATAAVSWANAANQTSPTNRGDGIPDGAYVRCTQAAPCTPYQMMNAVSARIYVLVRAERTTSNYTDQKTYNMGSTTLGPFNDGYKRHLFTQTVRFMNISGRRETP